MDLSHYILSLPLLLLVILRMLGVFMVAPVFSHVVVPLQVRVFLAVVVGLAV
ncbi:MAG: flagellar type III secretion system protein FliR, partial [Planctomycetaceae bacterium]